MRSCLTALLLAFLLIGSMIAVGAIAMGQVNLGICADQAWRMIIGLAGGLLALLTVLLLLLALINRELLEKSLSGAHILVISAVLTVVGMGLASYFSIRSAQVACPSQKKAADYSLVCQGVGLEQGSAMSGRLALGKIEMDGQADGMKANGDLMLADREPLAPISVELSAVDDLQATARRAGLLVLGENGQFIDWTDQSRSDWAPVDRSQAPLVACTGPAQDQLIETCRYGGGVHVARYRQLLPVRLVDARSGELLLSAVLTAEPPPCQPLGIQELPRLRARLTYQDFKAWLEKALAGEAVEGVTPSPTLVPPTATPTPLPTDTPQPTPTPQITGVVKTGARLRGGPSTDEAVITGLVKGDQVLVLGANSERTWLKVLAPGGETGWVFAELVTLAVDPAALPLAP
jgi:hypothetical protein